MLVRETIAQTRVARRNATDAGAVPASTHSKLNARTVLLMAAIIRKRPAEHVEVSRGVGGSVVVGAGKEGVGRRALPGYKAGVGPVSSCVRGIAECLSSGGFQRWGNKAISSSSLASGSIAGRRVRTSR